jgi:hypothetical protein
MRCSEARERLAEIASGELDPELAEAVWHAAQCPSCGSELTELAATIGLCRRAAHEPLPEGFSLKLHNRLLIASGTHAPPKKAGT